MNIHIKIMDYKKKYKIIEESIVLQIVLFSNDAINENIKQLVLCILKTVFHGPNITYTEYSGEI